MKKTIVFCNDSGQVELYLLSVFIQFQQLIETKFQKVLAYFEHVEEPLLLNVPMPVVNNYKLQLVQLERVSLHQLCQSSRCGIDEMSGMFALIQRVNLLLELLVLGEGMCPAEFLTLDKLISGIKLLLDLYTADC